MDGRRWDTCLRGSLGTGTLHRLPGAEQSTQSLADDDSRRFALTRSPHTADFGRVTREGMVVYKIRKPATLP